MNYKSVFVIDDICFDKRRNDNEKTPNYVLSNFDYLGENLDKEIYLKQFYRIVFIDLHILELENFIEYQFVNSKDQQMFLKVIELEVLPKLDFVINNAQVNFTGSDSYLENVDGKFKKRSDSSVVFCLDYEDETLRHITAWGKLEEDLKKREIIIERFLNKIKLSEHNSMEGLLRWVGKPSHLAYLMSMLAQKGYIEAPFKRGNEINYSELTKQIGNSFITTEKINSESMRKYASVDNEKFGELDERFRNRGFELPDSREMG